MAETLQQAGARKPPFPPNKMAGFVPSPMRSRNCAQTRKCDASSPSCSSLDMRIFCLNHKILMRGQKEALLTQAATTSAGPARKMTGKT